MTTACPASREAVEELMDPGGCPLCGKSSAAHNSESALCPGGCGCRLGTDDADRYECGCDEGCCDSDVQPDPYLDPIAAGVDPPEYDPDDAEAQRIAETYADASAEYDHAEEEERK